MYKFLLCWRYLLTRYLALACIISVMLGVATLIVVNSVMAGFSTKLKNRLHGLLSDVIVESFMHDGFSDPQEKIDRIRKSRIGKDIQAMTPVIEILGLVQIAYRGEWMQPRPVRLIGVDPIECAVKLGGFAEYLTDPQNRANPDFRPNVEAKSRHDLVYPEIRLPSTLLLPGIGEKEPPVFPGDEKEKPRELAGAFVGYAIGNMRSRTATAETKNKDIAILQRGDEVILSTVSGGGQRLVPVYSNIIVSDFFRSEMSEYDANYIFVPFDWLQKLRTMDNRATAVQIRLKDFNRAPEVVAELQPFPAEAGYQVETWEDKQGALLSAIAIEKGILNVLLFLIVGVAGFGILSIFAMIVVEKTRDIGVLKALGASKMGVMNIFLGYGLLLGLVGAGLGTALGLTLTSYINEIEHVLGRLTGHELFDRSVYYFDSIPTDVQAWTVILVNVGAVLIAVVFSVLPALRAASLHPVRALRYE